jgi:hypothetical protein
MRRISPKIVAVGTGKVSRMRLAAVCTLLFAVAPALAAPQAAVEMPTWLPRYDLTFNLDLEGHKVSGQLLATWTNPHSRPTQQLVFNVHSHYFVPARDVGLMAKTLEILRVNPSEALLLKTPVLDVQRVSLVHPAPHGKPDAPLVLTELTAKFTGDTNTTLVVDLPFEVGPNGSVMVQLDFTMDLPQKQGRWGQWRDVCALSNWLPVFAFYGDPPRPRGDGSEHAEPPCEPGWQPTPFVPWHQPFFNESCRYRVHATLPCGEKVACTGSIVHEDDVGCGKRRLEIVADGVRDFAFLCSKRFECFEGEAETVPGAPPVKIHVLAFPEHRHYARVMLRLAAEALHTYSSWFGPYPYPEYTIVEAFFGWNGNECSTLVMIDERIFDMPHLAEGYVQYLLYHETCHQWWYNLVGTNGYCETWMDEALATYFSHRMLNERIGKNNDLMHYPKGLDWLPNIRRDDYRSYGMYGSFGRGENAAAVQPMEKFGHLISLFSNCYDKGARIVGMIEDRVGADAFMSFCQVVYRKYRYRILRVADFQRELEAYTGGKSWEQFFHDWLYGPGMTDWAVESVEVEPPPSCARPCWCRGWKPPCLGPCKLGDAHGLTRVVVHLKQKAKCNEPTCVGFEMPGCKGYSIRVPIEPSATCYEISEPPANVEVTDGCEVRVEVLLPDTPVQVAVDPDQVLIDRDPANNFWKTPIRWRVTPVYTFLEETDLTNAYDRWNIICGPWIYGATYDDPWFTRSTMVGVRAGLYRTQQFSGGVYAAYRTDYRDVVAGVDGLWEHWPDCSFQTGFDVEQRLDSFENGKDSAVHAAVFERYLFMPGSSLYLQPAHYIEGFASYSDNFFPYPKTQMPGGERFDRITSLGVHYRLNYLTPYWDPEGGLLLDLTYQGGAAELQRYQALNSVAGEFSTLFYLPDLTNKLDACPKLQETIRPALEWLADSRLAVRAYGAMGLPTRGLFFTLGGGELFRGFDQAERQGSTVWVGSVELRVPLAKGLTWDVCDHVLGLRNVYGAAFYDVGDAYVRNHEVAPVAHAVGGGLRLDMAWFGFVERTMFRFDVAKAVNVDTSVQFWFGIQQPF